MLKGKIDSWGIEVEAVEIKNLDLPEAMQRAFAREAESTREARARVIKADGELLASEKLASAAKALQPHLALWKSAGSRRSPRSAPSTTAQSSR